MSERPQHARTFRRLLVNPVATFVLAFGLVIDAESQPRSTLVGRVFSTPMCRCGMAQPTGVAAFTPDGEMVLMRPDEESWDAATRAMAEAPERTVTLWAIGGRYGEGLWAPVTDTKSVQIHAEAGSEVSAEGVARARAEYARTLAERWDWLTPADLATLQARNIRETRVLWGGVVHSAAACAVVAAFVWSLGWVPAMVRRLNELPAARRSRAGLCGACGYNLSGLAGSRCPECGTSQDYSVTSSSGSGSEV